MAGISLALLSYAWLPETHAGASTQPMQLAVIANNYSTLLLDREYVSALTWGGMLTAGNFAWTAAAPFLFKSKYYFSAAQYGNIALLIGAGYVAGTLLSDRFSRRAKAPDIVYSGMALALLASIALNLPVV